MTEPFESNDAHRQRWLLLVLLLVCVLAYLRGLFGGFVFDDFGSIVQNSALRALDGSGFRWLALALSSNAGVLRRPLSMLSFGVDYSLFGLNPLAFKSVNLAIHLMNGLLIYRLGLRLIPQFGGIHSNDRPPATATTLALLATALWLLHPLNVSNVVYVVQRMNLLASLFMLAGLVCYAESRARMLRDETGLTKAIIGLCAFGLLAIFSKENGALIFVYALVIEVTCYRFSARAPYEQRALKAFFAATVAVPIVFFVTYSVIHPQWLSNGYAGRDFTLVQRVLSETRVLCDYLLWTLIPLPHWLGMYHDDFVTSTGLLQPVTTLLAIAFLASLGTSAWILRKRNPAYAFGILWFFAGHSMESTVIPLELIFEHRNYLPMAGLVLGAVCTAAPYLQKTLGAKLAAAVAGALLVTFGGLTISRAIDWSSEMRLALSEVSHHPKSSRALYEAGRQIIFTGSAAGRRDEAEQQAIPYFEQAKALDPTDLFSTSSLIIIRGRNGATVPPRDVEDLAQRVKTILLPHVNPFLVILTAATEGAIKLDAEQMKLLVESALDNKVFPPTMRAMILSDYGHYYFQILHDNQSAVSLTLAAAAEDPENPLFRVNLTKLALAIGQPDQAATQIAIAERLNKAGIYDATIADLKQRIEQLLKSVP